MKSRLFSSVLLVVVLLVAGAVPASAILSNHCDIPVVTSFVAPYNQNTGIANGVGSVAARGVTYKNGTFAAFDGTLVKPASGIVSLSIGNGAILVLGWDGNLFVWNGSPAYPIEVSLDSLVMFSTGNGWGRDVCTR